MKKYISLTGAVFAASLALLPFSPVFSQANAANAVQAVEKAAATNKRPYEALIRQVANKHKVPVNLAHAVIRTESNYNPKAKGSVGEIGLMQLRLATARSVGYTGSASGLYDPQTNLEYGMRYLAQAHKLSAGSTCGTILKYNAGHGAKRMNPVSAKYCGKVKAYLASVK